MTRLAFAAALLACSFAQAEALPDALVPYAFPFPDAQPAQGNCELDDFLHATQDARIIGLGEPTHGTAEVFRLKHCLIRRLVESGKVRHLVFEMSVGEGEDLDDYVAGGRDDLDAMLLGMPLWMFQAEGFADLLRWLREYNASAATSADQVRVHGMEAQYADRSARHALAYLREQDPVLAEELEEAFGPERVASATASAKEFAYLYSPNSDATLDAYQGLFLGLRAALDGRRETFVAATGEPAFLRARRHVSALGQFTSLALLEAPGAQAQLRDYVMAVNVADVVAQADKDERVVVWGHNEHVWKREGNGGYDVLGRQLARWFGPGYYAVGFDFGSGAYRAPGSEAWIHEVGQPEPGSFTAALARAGEPNIFLDLRAAQRTAAGQAALEAEFVVRASAGGYVPMSEGRQVFDQTITLGDRYDGLLFVSRSTPTTLVRPTDRPGR